MFAFLVRAAILRLKLAFVSFRLFLKIEFCHRLLCSASFLAFFATGIRSSVSFYLCLFAAGICVQFLSLPVSFFHLQHRDPGEIKRREVELDPQPRRDHEQGGGAWLQKLDFFRFGLFLNSSATDIVLVTAQHGS